MVFPASISVLYSYKCRIEKNYRVIEQTLIIHADDDRNVPFNQSTDLVKRLVQQGVLLETLVIPDDTHHWMKHSNALKVGNATATYLQQKLLK